MGLPDQLAQRREIAKAIFDRVVIDRVIAVIVSIRAPGLIATIHAVPVVVPRRQPQCSDAELFEIRQMVDDAAQVAAMKRAWIVAIVCLRRCVSRRVVRRIAVGKTIDHDQVDNVVCIYS